MPRKRSRGATSFMYPSLHEEVQSAVSDYIGPVWFEDNDADRGSNRTWSTNLMATFKCHNQACSAHGWASKKVAIVIRRYGSNRYNAVVFNQRCRECNQLGSIELDEQSYVDRVAYRLKKWAGLANMDRPPCRQKRGPPHRRSLCEGCKRGVCQSEEEE